MAGGGIASRVRGRGEHTIDRNRLAPRPISAWLAGGTKLGCFGDGTKDFKTSYNSSAVGVTNLSPEPTRFSDPGGIVGGVPSDWLNGEYP